MIPKEIWDTVVWDTHRKKQIGGQICGSPNYGVKLISKECGFEISTDGFRTQIQGREFCEKIFELYLEEIKAI